MQRLYGLYDSCVITRNHTTAKFDLFDIAQSFGLTRHSARIIINLMDAANTSTEDLLRILLVRTAVMQANNEAILGELKALREGQTVLQEAVAALQIDVAGIKGTMAHFATQADVEKVRTELYKAMEAQTWRLLVWMTAVCSGLTAAVYYIARNVH
ncbi:hypothetical protein GJ698_21510 [Pseudoduganella sp. FT26W]|uniref:Uncharacterized protein n=1 Tax=Duganella aquatilis TaxID=2666082 RepID=A0A844D1H6_9BURK|nr:hypothetical protein [Duganella aquatilis]MRW86653.1 hypothetical protein [Duganella aquatilis]